MAEQVQNPRSAAAIMDLIIPLPLSHPSIPTLLALQPLAHPSAVPHSVLVKFANRLNAAVLGRDGERDTRAASSVAERLVRDDQEGWILSEYGKGWANACLTELANNGITLHRLSLLENLILVSPQYPSFEREAVHPIMGKVAVTLTRALGPLINSETPDVQILSSLLRALYNIINHSPAPFRATLPTLRPALQALLVPNSEGLPAAHNLKESAADCLAALHLTNGKAQIPSSWASEMKSALGGIGMAMNGIVGEGWFEDTFRVVPPAAPSGFSLPTDPTARLPVALAHLEGWVEAVLALLRFPTSRAVPVPIAQLVAAGLRCLNLTLDTPTLPYISPQHRASLIASLPQIWTVGMHLIAAVANTVGDHLFPHLSAVLDHTVWLAETVPSSMRATHIQLLRFHSFILEQYPASLVPVEYPTRLLRLSLSQLAPLLDAKAPAPAQAHSINGSSTSKRGKKRARGAEDGLVGGLEGRDRATLAQEEVDVVVESLKLVPLIHPTPTLAPALLTFSIRLHISLYLGLPTISHLLQPPTEEYRVKEALSSVLEKAALMTEGEAGTSRGWKTVILSVLEYSGGAFSTLLHPSLPAMHRPQPPLAQLHYLAPESDEERRLRLELGFTKDGEVLEQDQEDTGAAPVRAPAHGHGLSLGLGSRPNVTVSTQDTNSTATDTTRTAPAPSTSDLTLQATLVSDRQAVPYATITTPVENGAGNPINLDSAPRTHDAQAIEDRAMASTSAPLQAASFVGYPQIPMETDIGSMAEKGKAKKGKDQAEDKKEKEKENEKATVPAQALRQGLDGDDDDEPLPEMDSDMDLSDEEGGDEEDEDEDME